MNQSKQKSEHINIHWMKKQTLVNLMNDDKVYAKYSLEKKAEFILIKSMPDLDVAIKNKSVWGLKHEIA